MMTMTMMMISLTTKKMAKRTLKMNMKALLRVSDVLQVVQRRRKGANGADWIKTYVLALISPFLL
jgi:hypothetical protein